MMRFQGSRNRGHGKSIHSVYRLGFDSPPNLDEGIASTGDQTFDETVGCLVERWVQHKVGVHGRGPRDGVDTDLKGEEKRE